MPDTQLTAAPTLAVIPGDGIGPEVTAEALKVLEVASPVKFESTRYDLGAERYLATGEVLPDSVLAEIRGHDAILLGAVGGRPNDPNLPPGILERGLLLKLRFELDHYVNLRPSRLLPGSVSPLAGHVLDKGEVDFVVVREGTEGPYTGNGGALRVGTPAEVATEVSVNTAYGVERVVRDALLLRLRFELDHYVNLRPSRLFPGTASPLADHVLERGDIDFVVVREGTEGPYTGNGGALRVGTPAEIATEVSVNTAYGVERVVRDAFTRAAKRPRKKLTLVHKTNVLVNAGSLWWRLFESVGTEFPDVTTDYIHIDAAMIFMATDPARFDVIVTDNLFGDIITDLAAAITGGIGLAASGNVNPDRTTPSMFEPVHGSAPDIAGQQKADPTAAILSGALLLDHLGHGEAADFLEAHAQGEYLP